MGIGAAMELSVFSVVIACVLIISSSMPFAAAADKAIPRNDARDNYRFITGDAKQALARGRRYDYIVVGGGAAGCPLAATLSQNFSVLLLERGDVARARDTLTDEISFLNPLKNNTVPYDGAERFMTEDGILGGRGRVLGGSTVVNAGLYGRAELEQIQAMQWDEKLVNESYEWVEAKVAFQTKLSQWQAGFMGAILSDGLLPFNTYTVDHIEGTRISSSTFDSNGERHSASELLSYANPDNIVVLVNHTASRVLFDLSGSRPKAVGVQFTNAKSQYYNVFVKTPGEVILSAGAIGSPQLLLLSGIGPYRKLKTKDFSIPIVSLLPGVGESVADNPRSDIFLLSKIPMESSSVQVVGIPDQPDVYFEAGSIQDHIIRDDDTSATVYAGWLLIKVGHPRSLGRLWLRSRDPRDNVAVLFNYYSDPHDLKACIEGARIMQRLNQSSIIQAFAYENASAIPHHLLPEFAKFGPSFPSNTSDDAAMATFCKDSLITIWHYHGGCNLGSVVDVNSRVLGVDALRVVDASIFNDTPGTNPQATYMMAGRYQGEKIRLKRMYTTLNVDKSLGHNAY